VGLKCDDPIECGHEAALGQWEARWEMLKTLLKMTGTWGASHDLAFERVEDELPTGLPVGGRWVPRMTGRVNIQLEPERASRLVQVLRSAGAHPSGLGSYPAANDANALADDIANMLARQVP
jgi:hypothetical protein